jgi:hypothetical protein
MKTMAQNRRLRIFFFSYEKRRQLDHGHFLSSTLVGVIFKGRAAPFYASGLLRKVKN